MAQPTSADRGTADIDPPELRRARAVSYLLDSAIRVPGTNIRVGLDPMLGVLPAWGDAVAAAASLYPVAEAISFGASGRTVARMLLNVAVDVGGGSVPVVGTLVDVLWKANERNVDLLEAEVRRTRA